MKKGYDFSRGVRRKHRTARVGRQAQRDGENGILEDDPPLTGAEMQELDRRAKDLRDRTRYLLVSALSPRFVLYYNVSEDTYGMNEPVHASLFKRRAAAIAVKRLLGGGVEIVQCRVNRHGRLVLNSVAVPTRSRRRSRKGRGRRR